MFLLFFHDECKQLSSGKANLLDTCPNGPCHCMLTWVWIHREHALCPGDRVMKQHLIAVGGGRFQYIPLVFPLLIHLHSFRHQYPSIFLHHHFIILAKPNNRRLVCSIAKRTPMCERFFCGVQVSRTEAVSNTLSLGRTLRAPACKGATPGKIMSAFGGCA